MKKVFFILINLCLLSLQAQVTYNKLDDNGKKHGLWRGFYEPSNNLKYEGSFEHGKETGVFTFYANTTSKTVVATRTFKPNTELAYTIFFDENKNIISEGNVLNKAFEGEWKYYHPNSKTIMSIENYSNGKLNGLKQIFYTNSKLAEETHFINGIKNGAYKKISESGIVLEESNFKDGVYEGKAVFKDALGQTSSEGQFINGKKSGIWRFYVDGKKVKEVDLSIKRNLSKKDNY